MAILHKVTDESVHRNSSIFKSLKEDSYLKLHPTSEIVISDMTDVATMEEVIRIEIRIPFFSIDRLKDTPVRTREDFPISVATIKSIIVEESKIKFS